MSDLIYDDETSSSFATVVNDDEQHRVRLTANVAGDITFDDETSSSFATVTGDDGKNHRVQLVASLYGGGGGGGTSNYNELSNRPKINGVTLSGDKTSADLGIESLPAFSGGYKAVVSGVVAGRSSWCTLLGLGSWTSHRGYMRTDTVYILDDMATITINDFYKFSNAEDLKPYHFESAGLFYSELHFSSGSTPTTFTVPSTCKMKGADCSNGVFVPAANKRYFIMFMGDYIGSTDRYYGLVVSFDL